MVSKFMNTQSIEHTCRHCTTFKSDRGDLHGGVRVSTLFDNKDPKQIMADFMEFGAWHAVQIHPNLNGFQGYDCVRFIFDEESNV